MMRIPAFVAILLVSTVLMAGCGKKSPTAPKMNASVDMSVAEARISAVIAQQPEVVEDGQFQTSDSSVTLAGVRPLRFWRRITHVDRTVEFAFSDTDTTGKPTVAIVTVRKLLSGQFNIVARVPDSTGTDSTTSLIHKPLADEWVRRLLFRRVPHHDFHRGWGDHRDHDGADDDSTEDWRLVGTSGVQVTSQEAQTRIVSVRVQAGSVDSTITDPLAFFMLRGVLHFNHDDQVTLTVTTLRNDDVVFLLLTRHRIFFKNNGDNTYTATLPMPREECVFSLRHIGVNALSHGTLFDGQAPYDSQAWIAPFAVRPFEMAAYLY